MAKLLTRPVALGLLLGAAACGGEPRGLVPVTAAGSGSQSGPDALVLRAPLTGGTPHVYSYTRLDSVVWTGASDTPAIDRVLGFDADAGTLLAVDARERPMRLDLRAGTTERVSATPVLNAISGDGASVYGMDDKGNVVRLTTTASWTYKPPRPARSVYPEDDGALLVVSGRNADTRVWKLFPPESKIVDSARFPATWRTLPDEVGERLYLVVDSGLVGLNTRTLDWTRPVGFDDPIAQAVVSPSGDRVFVLPDSSRRLVVVDRYRDAVADRITLPGVASDLRFDPLGRYLLAREAGRDSAWVVAIGTYRVLGAVGTAWRRDLPFVGPDGAIALAQGKDVTFVDGETLRPTSRVSGGALDFWYPFHWNGFRPRASSLDQPVSFNLASADSARTAIDAAAADSAARAAQRADSLAARQGAAPRDSAAARVGYIVSFAALLSESRAQELASQITVEGRKARIVVSNRESTPIYRVVLGPYPTRDEADRVGRASQHTYWVYEATP
ncbi:MAG: SPOR domain-containing protein [Gemmatimonadota bacterium]|nr:SPOR domain-containing protein [Gemmatimonadota bacterium]